MNKMGRIPDFAVLPKQGASAESESDGMQDILLTLRRWRLVILAFMLLGGGAAGVIHFNLPARYTATSTVVLLSRPDRLEEPNASGLTVDDRAVQSEITILKSAVVAGTVVDALNLVDDPEWNSEGSSLARIVAPGSEMTAEAEAINVDRREVAIQNLNRATAVRGLDNSYAIEVRVSAATPSGAARLTDAIVSAYFDWHNKANSDRAGSATDWLGQRLGELRKEVEDKESLVEAYRVNQGLLSAEGSTLTEQQLAGAQASASDAERQLAETMARLRQVEDLRASGGSLESSAAALDSQVIQNLRIQEADIKRRLATLKSTYYDTHPDVQKAEAEHQDIRAAIDTELGRILVGLRNEVDVAQLRLTSSKKAMAASQQTLGRNNESLVRLRELERDAAASRESYEAYLAQYQQTTDRKSLLPMVARQMSPAAIPLAPDKPSLLQMIAFGAALGLFACLALMIFRRLTDDRLHGATDVNRKVGRRALVSIPYLPSGSLRWLPKGERHPAGYAIKKPFSAYAETYRVLRKLVNPVDAARKNLVVAVTSAFPGEGKTTTAWSLARVAALAGQRVVIIDCDFRQRSLTAKLPSKPLAGLSRAVVDAQALKEVMITDLLSTASIIPAVPEDMAADDLLGSDKMAQLIDDLRRVYDLVILDCPPILAVADAISAAALADSTVVVTRAGKTSSRVIRSAIYQVESAGGFVVGLALNCVGPNVVGSYSFDDSLYFKQAKRGYYVN